MIGTVCKPGQKFMYGKELAVAILLNGLIVQSPSKYLCLYS